MRRKPRSCVYPARTPGLRAEARRGRHRVVSWACDDGGGGPRHGLGTWRGSRVGGLQWVGLRVRMPCMVSRRTAIRISFLVPPPPCRPWKPKAPPTLQEFDARPRFCTDILPWAPWWHGAICASPNLAYHCRMRRRCRASTCRCDPREMHPGREGRSGRHVGRLGRSLKIGRWCVVPFWDVD